MILINSNLHFNTLHTLVFVVVGAERRRINVGKIVAMGNKNSLHANTTEELQNFRIELTKQLPFFLAKATDEYKAFIATDTSTDAKSFAAYQTACRTALSHLQLLIRIAAWAEHTSSKDIMSDSDDNFDQLIMEARTAIEGHSKEKY